LPAAPSPRRFAPKALLGGLIALLCAGILPQTFQHAAEPVLKPKLPLADYLPVNMAGWHGIDQPLAETEALAGSVKTILNYDDTVYRVYRKGDMQFSVYVSYWSPGKMPAREVAFHIPDKCWTAAGMKRTAADYSYERTLEGRPLAPAQYREFEATNLHQKVIYWHIYDGKSIVYNPDGSPSNLSLFTDLLRRGLNQRAEQFFIRISSPGGFDELWPDAGFQEILEHLAPLGPGLHAAIERF
jgi:hypothetical protein